MNWSSQHVEAGSSSEMINKCVWIIKNGPLWSPGNTLLSELMYSRLSVQLRKYILEQFAQEEETTFLQSFVQSIDTLQFKIQSIVQDAEYCTLGSQTILCYSRVLCRVQSIGYYTILCCTFWVVKLYSAIAEYCAEYSLTTQNVQPIRISCSIIYAALSG